MLTNLKKNYNDFRMSDREFMMKLGRGGYSFLVNYLNHAEVNDTYKRRLKNIGRDFKLTMGDDSGDLHSEISELFSKRHRSLDKKRSYKFDDFRDQLNHFGRLDKIHLIDVIGRESFVEYFYKFIFIEILRFIETGNDVFPEYFEMLLDDPIVSVKLYRLANRIILDDYDFRGLIEESIMEIIQGLDYNASYYVKKYSLMDVKTGEIIILDGDLDEIDNLDLSMERYQTMSNVSESMLVSIVQFFSQNMYNVREHGFFPVLEKMYNVIKDYHPNLTKYENDLATSFDIYMGNEEYTVSIYNRADYHILYEQISRLVGFIYRNKSDEYYCDVESEDWARFYQYCVVEGDTYYSAENKGVTFKSELDLHMWIVRNIAESVENYFSNKERNFTDKLYGRGR